MIESVFLDTVRFQSGGYNISDSVMAAYYILKTFREIEGKETFGTGFPILPRGYPLLEITPNYTIIYDASQA